MESVSQSSQPSGMVDPETLKERQQDEESPSSKTEPDEKDQKEEKNDQNEDKNLENGEEKTVTEKENTEQKSKEDITTDKPASTDEKSLSDEAGTMKEKVNTDNDVPDEKPEGLLAQAPLVHPETSSASASPRHDPSVQEYHLKWIDWNDRRTPIVTQNENGPCPLIAILNVLLLRAVIEVPEGVEIVAATQLFNYLGNVLLQRIPKDANEAVKKNFEKNMSDAMEIVSKLQTGLDVNVRFTGVGDFEYTQECLIFDLLNISLYHGWLYDPQNMELISAMGTCTYNQLVEKIIESKNSTEELELHQGLVAENFLQTSAAQLTYHGLCELNSTIKNNQLCVLFRNNHFSTLCKHDDTLYILVTDQGFLTASNVVWESLSNVEGDSLFYDGAFERCMPDIKTEDPASPMSTEQQIDSDFLVALSMQEDPSPPCKNTQAPSQSEPNDVENNISDQELAMKLQQEEDLQAARIVQEQEQAAAGQQADAGQQRPPDRPQNGAGGGPPPQPRQGRRDNREKSCIIL